ncbi:MAG: ABC transporter permease [Symbiobacteriia bacterium]
MNRSQRLYLVVGGLMVAAVLFVAVFAGHITTISPYYADAKASILQGSPPFGISALHPLGTDQFGRDVWARVAYGTRWSLLFAFLIMAARVILAVPAAALGSSWPKSAGRFVSRLYVYTSAIPPLLVYLFILNPRSLRVAGLWPSILITVAVLTFFEWPRLAVVLMGRLEALAAEEFVEGAVAVGASRWRIFWRHLGPHLWPTLIQQVVAEMGRALLLIAQLGIFGIWIGGGVAVIEETMSGETVKYVAGIPEWGTMLASARTYIRQDPWMPLAPAFAFLIAVTGFNVLSQGIENATFSWRRLREATSSRLSPRWRWTLVPVAVLAVTLFYGGAPWGRRDGITALAEAQNQAMARSDVDGYLATFMAGDPSGGAAGSTPGQADYREAERAWAGSLLQTGATLKFAPAGDYDVQGNQATVMWGVTLGDGSKQPPTVVRSVHLVRRWDRWYVAGDGLTAIRGFFVDLQARYSPADPSIEEGRRRGNVHYLATALDHAWAKVQPLLPPEVRGLRPQIVLYSSPDAFEAALVGLGGPGASATIAATVAEKPQGQIPVGALPGSTGAGGVGGSSTPVTVNTGKQAPSSAPSLPFNVWYTPGGPVRISPRFVHDVGFDRSHTERLLGEILMEYALSAPNLRGEVPALRGEVPALRGEALLVGDFEARDKGISPYPLDPDLLAGNPLFSLPDLLSARLGTMPFARQSVYVTQAAMLKEYMTTRAPAVDFVKLASTPDPLAALAAAAGMSPEELTRGYARHLEDSITAMSVLATPVGRERIPVELTNAVTARTQAAVAGDDARFVNLALPQFRGAQEVWLHEARQTGLRGYQATVLDMGMQNAPNTAQLYLLERLEFGDGRVTEGIIIQDWVNEGGKWLASGGPTPLMAKGS